MATTHDKIVSNRYKLMKKPYQEPKLTRIALYWQDLNRKITDLSQKITPETEKKYKKLMQADVKHFQEKIFSDSQIYGLFFGDYIRGNPKIMGDFKDKLSSVSKKIGNLNFAGLTQKQITSKVAGFFEENLQNETMDLAHDVQVEFEKQRKEIVKNRIKQWWRQEQLAGTANTLKALSISELEAYLMNTPAILNDDSIINKPENLSNHQFNKLVENAETAHPVDKVQVISHDFCSFKDCLTENGVDKEKIVEAAKIANETGADIHLSKMFETNISYSECPFIYNYSSDELKEKVTEYLSCVNESFENLTSVSYICDTQYTYKPEDFNGLTIQNPQMVEAHKRIRPSESKPLSQEEVNDIYQSLLEAETNGNETSQESISHDVPGCVWESKWGSDWEAELFTMGMEELPGKTLYYSETNLDNPQIASETINKRLNKIRTREIELEEKLEKETGNPTDITLVGGLELKLPNQTTEKSPNYDVLSHVVESVFLNGENGGIPVRISDIELPTTELISNEQSENYNELGEFLVKNAYNIAPGGVEFIYSDATTSNSSLINPTENKTENNNEKTENSIKFDINQYLEYLNEQMEKSSKSHKNLNNKRSFEYSSNQIYM